MSRFGSLLSVQAALLKGEVTCCQLVEYYLDRIQKTRHLNAYIEIWEQEAMQKARALDHRIKVDSSNLGRLFGAVLSIKDTICYKGHYVTASSRILENYLASYSATVVERLMDEGAILIGRTNCDQFGMGSSNENSIYGPVCHPADNTRVSGGSSGGAAVSVATDTCLAAIGSDTGGSVRQPAGFCGLWGFKPSYGQISRHGLIAYASSFDQIGFIGRSAEDLSLLTSICSGPDGLDATVSPQAKALNGSDRKRSKLRLAYFSTAFQASGIDEGVRVVLESWMQDRLDDGHYFEGISFELLPYAVPAYYILTTAEASTNLSRYDGVRYGCRTDSSSSLKELYQFTRSEGFSEEVKRRIMLGTYVLSSGYYDAYYTKAQQVRRLISERVKSILEDYDAVVLPVSPVTAWKIGVKSADPTEMYLSDIFTVLANLCGSPAVAIPIGLHPANGMPIGIQLMGRNLEDLELLEMAQQLYS